MKKIKIGLAGLGVVGRGVYEILQKDAEIISKRSGCKFEIIAVSARNKKDFIDQKVKFYSNVLDLAFDDEVEVVIEVIGGCDIAKNFVETAIKNGKKVITANKALLAEHGFEIAKLAEKAGVSVGFEAAVAGATPIIKVFKEAFAANKIEEFYAILNGSCNFILTKMQNENLDFAFALKQAQDLGYAEADPAFDIKGIDTAHKLTILAAIASGTKPQFEDIYIEGIDQITIDDIRLAGEFGYKIKLLANYDNINGTMKRAVFPALVKSCEKIAQVDDAFNAIAVKTSNAGSSFIVGSGAGKLPTASAIVADLIDVACNRQSFVFGEKSADLTEPKKYQISQHSGEYFLKIFIDKEKVQNGDLVENIFGSEIEIKQAAFFDKNEQILCGFLTENLQENVLLEFLRKPNPQLVKSIKFIRIANF